MLDKNIRCHFNIFKTLTLTSHSSQSHLLWASCKANIYQSICQIQNRWQLNSSIVIGHCNYCLLSNSYSNSLLNCIGMASIKRNSQEADVTFPNQPSDGVSSISVNGTLTTPTNMLIAGSWDNNVRKSSHCFWTKDCNIYGSTLHFQYFYILGSLLWAAVKWIRRVTKHHKTESDSTWCSSSLHRYWLCKLSDFYLFLICRKICDWIMV